MRIVIAGASGFIGTPLVERLRAAGHEVRRLVRREPRGEGEVPWRPNQAPLDPTVVDGMDAAINLSGAGVGDKRWTERYQEVIKSSRVNSTTVLARALAEAPNPPRVLLNASAVGYYGDTGDREVDETAAPGTGFFPDVCVAWEAATAAAERAGIRVVHLRTGLALGPGGLLRPLQLPFRLGLGGRLGNGRQWMPWVSLADALSAIEFLLDADVSGPVNITGPEPATNAEFTRALGAVVHRPALLPVPVFALRVALGDFANEVVASQRVKPGVLTGAGFAYQHKDVASALHWALDH